MGPARLIGYGGLGLPLAALNLPLFVYLPTFYVEERGLSLTVVGLILLIARLSDVVSDPLIGALSDRTRSRIGRRLPWLIGAAPILVTASYMLFIPPAAAGAVHLLFWSMLAYLGWTAMILAYAAIGAEATGDYHERTKLTTAREICVVLGILVAAALPVVIGAKPASGEALYAIFVMMAGSLPVLLLVMTRALPSRQSGDQEMIGFAKGVRVIWQNRPFKRLIAAYLLNGIANGLPATLFLLFVEYRLGAPGSAGLLLLLYFAFGIAAAPVWLKISFRFGKHRTWALSMLWASLIFAAAPFLREGDLVPFIVICCLSGMSLGADLALPSSMQADVVDLDRLRSGKERTGLFFGLWGMATKLALAMAVGTAFPVLEMIGFAPQSVNDDTALLGLALLYGGLPVLLKLSAIALIWRFEIDESMLCRIRRHIETVR